MLDFAASSSSSWLPNITTPWATGRHGSSAAISALITHCKLGLVRFFFCWENCTLFFSPLWPALEENNREVIPRAAAADQFRVVYFGVPWFCTYQHVLYMYFHVIRSRHICYFLLSVNKRLYWARIRHHMVLLNKKFLGMWHRSNNFSGHLIYKNK